MKLIFNHSDKSITSLIQRVIRSNKPQTKEELFSFVFAYAYYVCRLGEEMSKDIAFFAFTNSQE